MGRWRTIGLVRVSGPSMVPTLRHGDIVLVRSGARVHHGDVVLARFRSMTDLIVIKRADTPADGGWLVRSDNPAAGGDSRVHGVADVQARAWLCWRASTHRLMRVR